MSETHSRKRFVGLYYFDIKKKRWQFIVDITGNDGWVVRNAHDSGDLYGDTREFHGNLNYRRFADKPFNVKLKHPELYDDVS